MSDDETVRPIGSAPSARAQDQAQHDAEQRQEHQRAILAAEIGAELNRAGQVVLHPANDQQRTLFKAAIRRAAKEIGKKVIHRTLKTGSLMAAVDEEPSPLQEQLNHARARNAIDDALGDPRQHR
ncbi:hypothetical protein J0910_04245 [Nocardiopsis sp. CNT-189]|uniref:hypothetical protein n=1 Tax=Nocardiopsis oceanisediminis TaxID=2816862 RepID=UPI003B301545